MSKSWGGGLSKAGGDPLGGGGCLGLTVLMVVGLVGAVLGLLSLV